MPITLTQLGSFLAVVRSGSITAAAEQLAVTQPSVSAALASLSRELGVELTEPVGRSVRPSAAGRAFAPFAAAVIEQLEQGARRAREAAAASAPELRVAAATTAGESFAPALIHAFASRHADVRVSLEVGPPDRVLRRLTEHAVDVALSAPATAEPGLSASGLTAESLVVVASPDHPAAGGPVVSLRDLAGHRWLLPDESLEHRAIALGLFGRHRLAPPAYILPSNAAIRSAAQAGLGLALMPERVARLDLQLGLLVEVPVRDRLPLFEWFSLRAESAPRSEPAERFLEWLRGPEAERALAPRVAPRASTVPSGEATEHAAAPVAGPRGREDGRVELLVVDGGDADVAEG
jgi:LysR family transcriptional regulator, low CO2-responsive transcriptional regulator